MTVPFFTAMSIFVAALIGVFYLYVAQSTFGTLLDYTEEQYAVQEVSFGIVTKTIIMLLAFVFSILWPIAAIIGVYLIKKGK